MEEPNNQNNNSKSTADISPKVLGIGGIFFFSDNIKEIKDWYAKNLGFEINEWGSVSFNYRDLNKPQVIIPLQWNPLKKDSDYFAPSKKEFMINYRVQNIGGLVTGLKEKGVTVIDEITNYEGIGKFVHIMDAEGNKIELWEPVDDDKSSK